MRHSLVLLLLVCFLTCFQTTRLAADEDAKAAEAHTKAAGRIEAAGPALDELEAAPDRRLPQEGLGSAGGVTVAPSLLKGGFVGRGRYGKGVASCRTEKGWSAPAFFTIGGGSFGLQIGGPATDLVMLIMNKGGMDPLLPSHLNLGADASAAAGPVGRPAAADTDWKMRAQVLTYSRSRGLFAGLELSGAVVKQDRSSTRDFYGHSVPFKKSLTGEVEPPKAAYPFLSVLAKWAQQASK